MSDNDDDNKPAKLPERVQDMKLEPGESHVKEEGNEVGSGTAVGLNGERKVSKDIAQSLFPPSPPRDGIKSPEMHSSAPLTPVVKSEDEEKVSDDVAVKEEPGQLAKPSRTKSTKAPKQPPQLFSHLPDMTSEAKKTFEPIKSCIYANKFIGTTDHAMECECSEEWDAEAEKNRACGEDSDCINRATKMECTGDCHCGHNCQNMRFQRRQYANVGVIKTEKKGYGLRANANLRANAFIFEYVGEVIGEATFRKRMAQYDSEGIKHFYFMSLNKGEFVDATKKGNLGRFCNHSCNPNCYVDKWVVNDKLRMGIFAERKILAGEELVFNYNVDRYGANPQPCYCGEPHCTGFIGGKTQTERGTKLSAATIEALGIDDGDGWDLAIAKKARKKKPGEEDEDYVDRVEAKTLDENGVVKVMATLMQCKEKWIAAKLLSRIQQAGEERVLNRIVKMHGYQILKSQLSMWFEDTNIILQILDILHNLPRITRNKIQDSGIEATVEKLVSSEDEKVNERASTLLKIWSALELGYRIPRHKRDPAALEQEWEERRRQARDRSKSKSKSRSVSPDIPKGPSAPTGPRGVPNRGGFHGARPTFRRPFSGPPLPTGWFSAISNGKTYYYSANGQTTWQRPTIAATQPPPPPKVVTNEQKLQDIINSITSEPLEKTPSSTPQPEVKAKTNHDREKPKEKWRTYDDEKLKKLYENTLAPHVMAVINKFKGKLPRDDLKRFGKEVSKKLVASDFKNNRIGDPTKMSEKQERGVKKFTKEYFDKAVAKRKEYERVKAEKKAKEAKDRGEPSKVNGSTTPSYSPPSTLLKSTNEPPTNPPEEDDVVLSEHEIDEDDEPSPSTHESSTDGEIKRKREAEETPLTGVSPDIDPSSPRKRKRSESEVIATPPPPPPPPSMPEDSPLENSPYNPSPLTEETAPYSATVPPPPPPQSSMEDRECEEPFTEGLTDMDSSTGQKRRRSDGSEDEGVRPRPALRVSESLDTGNHAAEGDMYPNSKVGDMPMVGADHTASTNGWKLPESLNDLDPSFWEDSQRLHGTQDKQPTHDGTIEEESADADELSNRRLSVDQQ